MYDWLETVGIIALIILGCVVALIFVVSLAHLANEHWNVHEMDFSEALDEVVEAQKEFIKVQKEFNEAQKQLNEAVKALIEAERVQGAEWRAE